MRKPRNQANKGVQNWARSEAAETLFLSVATFLELEIGVARMDETIRSRDTDCVLGSPKGFSSLSPIESCPIDLAVAQRAAALHTPGPRPARDALIAATAKVHGLTRVVDLRAGREGFDFLGCHFRARMSGRLWERKRIIRYYLHARQTRPYRRCMITNISLTTVYCLDQDLARDFYVDVLGFQPKTDISMGEGFRWVTVVHPNQPELEVTLMTPGPPLDKEGAAFVRRQLEKGQMGGLGLRVDDCRETHKELVEKGVTFLQEPADRPYGVEAVMRDNSGSWLVLVEPKEFTASDFD